MRELKQPNLDRTESEQVFIQQDLTIVQIAKLFKQGYLINLSLPIEEKRLTLKLIKGNFEHELRSVLQNKYTKVKLLRNYRVKTLTIWIEKY